MAITWNSAIADYTRKSAGGNTASTIASGGLTWDTAGQLDLEQKYGQ